MTSIPARPGAGLEPRKQGRARALIAILKEAVQDFLADKAVNYAAAIAFYAVFSLAPMLLVTISVAGMLTDRQRVRDRVISEFSSLMGPKGGEMVETMLKNADEPKAGIVATIVGIVSVLIGATGTFAQLKDALNTIWEVELVKKKYRWYMSVWRLLRARLLSLALLLVVAFLLLTSLVVSAGLAAAGSWASSRLPAHEALLQPLAMLTSVAVIAVLFAMIFKFLPDAKVRWRDVWLGALITAGLFELGKFAMGLYIGKSAVASTYGAAGSLVVVLLWVYYSALVLLFGAEITQAIAGHGGREIAAREGFVVKKE